MALGQAHTDVAAPAAREAPASPQARATGSTPQAAPRSQDGSAAARADALAGTLARAVRDRGTATAAAATPPPPPAPGPLLQRMPYVVQAGYMSGDMFGIAAAMVVTPGTGVVILKETNAKFATREEQSGLFKTFYEKTLKAKGVADLEIAQRVKVASVSDTRLVYKDLTDPTRAPRFAATVRTKAGLATTDTFIRPGQATTLVGDAYRRNHATATAGVRKAWGGTGVGPTEEQIKDFLTEKKIAKGKKYALLWVRLSAKTKIGGAHPELDTSIQGVRDLKIAAVARLRREPVIIGDNPHDDDLLKGAINLVEFWKQGEFAKFSGLDSRLAQLRLFEYLAREGYDLVSIGMRSGAMEAPALLGIPTTYIEERGNQQAERMQKWVGKVPGWSQAQVDELPTRTGRRAQFGAPDNLPALDAAFSASVKAVRDHVGGEVDVVRARLGSSYKAGEQESFEAFVEASISAWSGYLPTTVKSYATYVTNYEKTTEGGPWTATLRGLVKTWHAAYDKCAAAYDKLAELEAEIATLVGKSEDAVRTRLYRLSDKALNNDLGRAAFVDAALTMLESRPPASAELSIALAHWRSVFNGKASLRAGFTDPDLVRVLTPLLERELNRRAPALVEIDDLARMVHGTTANVVRRFAGSCESVEAFRTACLDTFVPGLRLKFSLATTTPKAAVLERLKTYRTTKAGLVWAKAFDDKTAALYTQLFAS